MTLKSPTCDFDFFAARARSTRNAAEAENSTPRRSAKIGYSLTAQQISDGQFIGYGESVEKLGNPGGSDFP